MGRLRVVERRRRDQDPVGGTAQVGDRPGRIGLGDVLDHLDARDEVVPILDGIGERRMPAAADRSRREVFDRPLRHVDAEGVDAP